MLTLLPGDAVTQLRTIPDASVQCCITSPPYWGLRDYGLEPVRWEAGEYVPVHGLPPVTFPEWTGQLGLEPDLNMFFGHIVQVFDEVWRVLRKDGSLWVNMGDCAVGAGLSGGTKASDNGTLMFRGAIGKGAIKSPGLASKNIVGQPWRVALALQARGWILRSDVVWHKPNPMPESAKDRPTRAHEYLFLLSKSRRYYYDADAIKEPVTGQAHPRSGAASAFPAEELRDGQRRRGVNPKAVHLPVPAGWDKSEGAHGTIHKHGRNNGPNSRMVKSQVPRDWEDKPVPSRHNLRPKQNESFAAACQGLVEMRHKRSVWTVATAPFKGSHFATFPPALIVPCILASSRAGDTILDPCAGSGTTLMAALSLGRKAIAIEPNPEYRRYIRTRCTVTPGLPGLN